MIGLTSELPCDDIPADVQRRVHEALRERSPVTDQGPHRS
jgi:hypothetical protein